MLLKSIKLENFRQFRNESIDFAQGEGGKKRNHHHLVKMERVKLRLLRHFSGACMEKQSSLTRLF